jgi:hypothetical protein
LIQELVRHTDEKHPDFEGLAKALEDVSKVALHINEAIRAQQNRLNVISIEQQFSGKVGLVSPSRRFVRQGQLTKKCRSDDRRYEFFLFNDIFLYASKVCLVCLSFPLLLSSSVWMMSWIMVDGCCHGNSRQWVNTHCINRSISIHHL